MFRYQNRLFVTIGSEVINIYCESILVAILDCEVSTNGILGDFSMSFYIIFGIYSEKFSLLRIYLRFTM